MQRARKDRGVYAGGKVDGKNSNGWRERWKEDERREKRMMENRRREKKKKGKEGRKTRGWRATSWQWRRGRAGTDIH